MLTSMLSLPESQRAQVRDELEDHLRSRVDDLLITGTPESEAIRIAVAELGETAELAKLISHAHTRINPRRRIMNIALITAAVAGLSIGGISLQNTAGTSAGGSGSVLVYADPSSTDDEKVRAFDVGTVSLSAVLKEIGKTFGRSVSFSRGAVGPKNRIYMEVHSQFAGKFTFDQAIEQFKKQFDEVSYGYNLEITADSVLFQTNDEYQRKRIETKVIPTPVWIERHELFDYAASLRNLLEVKHDLSMTSIEVMGEVVVVASVPEIHEEILKLVHELDVVIEQRNEERRIQQEAEKQARDKRRGKAYEQLMEQHADITERLAETREKFEINENSIKILLSQIEQEKVSPHPESPGIEQYTEFLVSRRGFSELWRNQIAEDEVRAQYLKDKILESEYLHLFDELD